MAGIRPQEAGALLVELTDSVDDDIVEAAFEAMANAEPSWNDEYDDEQDDVLFTWLTAVSRPARYWLHPTRE